MTTRIILIATALILLAMVPGARGDDAQLGSTANPADTRDPFAYVLNPSLAEVTADRVGVGYRVLHLNLLSGANDLRTGGLAFAGRRSFGGLAAGLAVLRTPLSRETTMGAGYGRWLGGGFIVGARLGLFQRSFRTSNFVVESATDPLLQGALNKTVPTLSLAGSWWRPDLGLTLAAVMDNPHEPDASLAGDGSDPLRPTLRLGASWEREALQFGGAIARDDWRFRWSLLGRGYVFGDHALGAHLGDADWRITARFAVNESFWVEYGVAFPWGDLASQTSGTHGLVLCWHQPTRPEPRSGPTRAGAPETPSGSGADSGAEDVAAAGFIAAPPPEPLGQDFDVRAARDTVRVRVKRLRREFAPDTSPALLARLPRWKVGVLDSTWSQRVTWSPSVAAPPAEPSTEIPRGEYSGAYQTQVQGLVAWLREHPQQSVVLTAPEAQLARARYLAERIAQAAGRDPDDDPGVEIRVLPAGVPAGLMAPVGFDSLPAQEEITLREYDRLPFAVRRLRPGRASTTTWFLEIRDSRGRTVQRLDGNGEPPAQLTWDWRDTDGRVVGVDDYTYRWGWTEADGGTYTVPDRSLLVIREVLQRTLRFGREVMPWQGRADARPLLLLEDRPAVPARLANEGEAERAERAKDSKQGAGE